MIENKIKLNIISNRKLCENENLEKQIEKIFSAYQRKIILEKRRRRKTCVLFVKTAISRKRFVMPMSRQHIPPPVP